MLPEHQISGADPAELSGEKKNYQIYEELQPTGKKQRYHELCTYFTVDASGTDLITRGDRFDSPNEPSVHFAWFPFEELPYIDLRPAFLKTEVQNLPEHTQFITLGD